MTHQETDPVVLSISEGVAVLRLNEPGSMNALSATIKQGMIELVPQVVADENVRAIVITGTGKAFCAGGDIRNMADRRPLAVRERMRTSHDWLELLMLGEKPVITIVNGVAAGAGLSLALIGDIILCADDAKFRAGFPGLGAVPDLGAIWTLPRAVGVPRARCAARQRHFALQPRSFGGGGFVNRTCLQTLALSQPDGGGDEARQAVG